GLMNIVFADGNLDIGDTHLRFPGTIEYQLSLEQVARKGASLESPAHMALAEIPGQIDRQAARMADLRCQLAASAAESMLGGDFLALGSAPWQARRQLLDAEDVQTVRLRLESPRRWANGFSCL